MADESEEGGLTAASANHRFRVSCITVDSSTTSAQSKDAPSVSHSNVRVSPYPLRLRTPPQPTPPSEPSARQRVRVSLDTTPVGDQHRLQLIVHPIVKNTVGQRDASGNVLEDFAANGTTFGDIVHKLWEKFCSHVKGQAVKQDGVWSNQHPTETAWTRVMQFKWGRHVVMATKTEQPWNRWVSSLRGETVTLMVYDYGLGIPTARSLEEFVAACIRPEHTDRSGAAAEVSLREVVGRLHDIWGATYQGSAVVWRMWANDIIRNLNRSTRENAKLDPPVDRVERLLRAADSEVEQHLSTVTRS